MLNSEEQTFEVTDQQALQLLGFSNPKIISESQIENLFVSKNLVDSLKSLINFREYLLEKFYEYSVHREEVIEQLSASIAKQRALTNKEATILGDLDDHYYDYHYNKYAQISQSGRQLMTIWNRKIYPFKQSYKVHTDELDRQESEYFRKYFNNYGWSFIQLAFKYGVIFNRNDENSNLEFSRVTPLE